MLVCFNTSVVKSEKQILLISVCLDTYIVECEEKTLMQPKYLTKIMTRIFLASEIEPQ